MPEIKRPDTSSKKEEFLAAIRASLGKAIRTQSSGSVSKPRILTATLLILGGGLLLVGLLFPDPMNIADEELNHLMNASTFTFIGTVKEMGNSNVSGINENDFPVIVEVESVEWCDFQALKKFGDLKGNRLTVAVNPVSRIVTKNDISAVFFADPLIYEEHIGVVATAVPIPDRKEDFLNKIHAAAFQKTEAPLRAEVKSADLIIVGEVKEVRPLPTIKGADLGAVIKSWEFRSEHRPRWAEAIIKVRQPVLRPPDAKMDFVSVVFPRSHDCFSIDSPKFEEKETGIWLLFQNQLAEAEKSILPNSEKYEGRDIQSYTALRAIDFQDISMLAKIQKIIAETK